MTVFCHKTQNRREMHLGADKLIAAYRPRQIGNIAFIAELASTGHAALATTAMSEMLSCSGIR
jgi:hypothetical protein